MAQFPTGIHLLTVPLEIRLRIYSFLFPDQSHELWVPSFPPSGHRSSHRCILDVLLCSKQIFNELHGILDYREISLYSSPEKGNIISNIPCLHGVDLSTGPALRIELNPFQYTTSLRSLWLSLLSTCYFLQKAPRIPHLRIEFDGTLPRTKPPLYLNEIDLNRGPLIIVLLLQPFYLLRNITKASIVILGGPRNNLWSKNTTLYEYATRLTKHMEGAGSVDSRQVVRIQQLWHQMQRDPSVLWFNDTYQNTYESLVTNSLTVPPSNETIDDLEDISRHKRFPGHDKQQWNLLS